MRAYDHRVWLEQCPEEYRELSIAISKMRSRLNNIWADNGGDDNPDSDSLGHRPMSEFGDMLWEMAVGTALPDNTDCLNGRARGGPPICDVHERIGEALGDPDREQRRRRYAKVRGAVQLRADRLGRSRADQHLLELRSPVVVPLPGRERRGAGAVRLVIARRKRRRSRRSDRSLGLPARGEQPDHVPPRVHGLRRRRRATD